MDAYRTVFVVRHGKVANPNHVVYADLPGFNLSPDGVREAHAAALHLAGRRIDRVMSSPLERAVATATAIARRHTVGVQIDPRLTEWNLNPRWNGERWDDLPTVVPGELEAYLASPDDLEFADESLQDVARRMQDAAEASLAEGANITVLVSHQDPIGALTLSASGRPLGSLLVEPAGHASITELRQSTSAVWDVVGRWTPPVHSGGGSLS